MTRYLLDTNVIADLVRHPQGAVARRLAEVGESGVCTSIVVAAEVRYGAEKRKSAELTARCEAALDRIEIVPLGPPSDAVYARERARLEASGDLIGSNDLLIAAHALALGCTLVTDNEREFARVAGLRRENWVRDR